jgi:translation elongation factor P/translation initiation factor 5A
MKEAQDLRQGNTVKINNELYIVMKAIYNKVPGSIYGKNETKNLATGGVSETVYRHPISLKR